MSFSWDRIGTCATTTEAETWWCDRQNVDPRDRDIIRAGEEFELRVRQGEVNDERLDGGRW